MTSTADRWTSRDLFAALVIVVVWGLNFVAMKFALHHFTPFQLGAARYIFAALPLIFVVRPPKVAARWVILYGLVQGVGQFGLLFTAIHLGMTAALASVLMQTQVFFTALFGAVLLKERLSGALRVGLVLAAGSLLSFSMSYLHGGAAAGVISFVLNLGAASMWAASNVVTRLAQRSAPQYDALGFVVWSATVPILPFILLSLLYDDPALRLGWLDTPWSGWAAVGYLGWMASVLAYGLWTWLLKHHSANRVAPFGLAVPVVGLTAGVLMLDERLDSWQMIGILFVFAALGAVFLATPVLTLLGRGLKRADQRVGPDRPS